MADRRSGRAKKTVDYSKFAAAGDSDDDDDFRESSTQPSKRKKTESVSPKSVKVKLKKIDEVSYKIETKKSEKQPKKGEDDEPKKRPSLSDKVFQRHLSQTLEISKQDTSLDRNGENESSLLLSDRENVKSSQDEKTEEKPSLPSEGSTVTENHSSCKKEVKEIRTKDKDSEWKGVSSSESDVEDDSDWSDENEEKKVKKPAVKNPRSSKKNQSDESDWSDDDMKKKSKKPPAKKSVTKQQTKTLISPVASRSPAPSSLKCSKPSKQTPRSNPVSPALKPRVRNCATPCQVISSPVKLPPKGLRLGLSRKVSSKPLHSVIKVQP